MSSLLLPGTQHVGVVRELRRRVNSVNGNPRWTLYLESGSSWNTKTDCHVGLKLSPSWVGDHVTVVVDGRGQIIDAERTPDITAHHAATAAEHALFAAYDAATPEARSALEDTTTLELLTKAYQLTHRLDTAQASARLARLTDSPVVADLRAQRDLITAELLNRANYR